MSYLFVTYESNKKDKGHVVVKCDLSQMDNVEAAKLRLGAMGMMPGGNRQLVKSGNSYKKGVTFSCGGGSKTREGYTTGAGLLSANLTSTQAQGRVVELNLLQTQKEFLQNLGHWGGKEVKDKLSSSLKQIDSAMLKANGDKWTAMAVETKNQFIAMATDATNEFFDLASVTTDDFFNLVDSTMSGAIAASFDSDQPGRYIRTKMHDFGFPDKYSGFTATDSARNMAEAAFKQGESFLMDPEESVTNYIDRIEKYADNFDKESGLQTASRYVNTFFGQETATQALRNMTDKPNAFHDFCRWRRQIRGKETFMDKAKVLLKKSSKEHLGHTKCEIFPGVQDRWNQAQAAKKEATSIIAKTAGSMASRAYSNMFGSIASPGLEHQGTRTACVSASRAVSLMSKASNYSQASENDKKLMNVAKKIMMEGEDGIALTNWLDDNPNKSISNEKIVSNGGVRLDNFVHKLGKQLNMDTYSNDSYYEQLKKITEKVADDFQSEAAEEKQESKRGTGLGGR